MGSRGPNHLRRTTNAVLDALVKSAETAYRGGSGPGLNALHQIVESLKNSSAFDDFYRRSYREVMEIVAAEELEQMRANAFGRLMVLPLGPLFDNGTFDRALLVNVFQFFHLVLGDDADVYGGQCAAVVKDLRDLHGDAFTWERFYDDSRARLVRWRALVRIAQSFKRWEVRRDWFLKLMQYTPATFSMGQTAFVVKNPQVGHPPTEPWVFGEREFCRFFHALFEPLTRMTRGEEDAFREEFGADPEHLIGLFLGNLATCQA